MKKVAKIFSANDVLLDVEASNKQALFTVIGAHWANDSVITPKQVEEGLHEREQLGSTALGRGIAIPHTRIKGLDQIRAVFIRTKTALDFDAPDGLPVSLFLSFLVPEQANDAHLEVLAEIAEVFYDKKFTDHLMACKEPAHIHETFLTWH